MFNGLIDEMISSGCTASDAGKFPRPPSDLPKTLLFARLFGPAASGRSNNWNPGIFNHLMCEPIFNTSNSGVRLPCSEEYITVRPAGDLFHCLEGLSTYGQSRVLLYCD